MHKYRKIYINNLNRVPYHTCSFRSAVRYGKDAQFGLKSSPHRGRNPKLERIRNSNATGCNLHDDLRYDSMHAPHTLVATVDNEVHYSSSLQQLSSIARPSRFCTAHRLCVRGASESEKMMQNSVVRVVRVFTLPLAHRHVFHAEWQCAGSLGLSTM